MERGYYAEAFENLSSWMLDRTTHPSILWVAGNDDLSDYNHYILYLASDAADHGHWVIDGTAGLVKMSDSELTSIWSGVGLVVSKNPISPNKYAIVQAMHLAARVAGTAGVLILVGWVLNRACQRSTQSMARTRRCFIESICLAAIVGAVGGGGVFPSLSVAGTLQVPPANLRGYPMVSLTEIRTRIAEGQGVLILDVGPPNQFARGHVENAVRIGPGPADSQLYNLVEDVDPSTHIVVFCTLGRCGAAATIANRLKELTGRPVEILRVACRIKCLQN